MIAEFTVTQVYKSDKDKQGQPLKTKAKGIPYTRVAIKVDYADYDGEWLSHMAYREDDPALAMEKDRRYKLKITRSGDGKFLNFDIPSRLDTLEDEVAGLKRMISNGLAGRLDLTGTKDPSGEDAPPF